MSRDNYKFGFNLFFAWDVCPVFFVYSKNRLPPTHIFINNRKGPKNASGRVVACLLLRLTEPVPSMLLGAMGWIERVAT